MKYAVKVSTSSVGLYVVMQRGGGLASKVTVAAQLTAGLGWAGLGWAGWAGLHQKPDTVLTRHTAYTRTLHSLTLAFHLDIF